MEEIEGVPESHNKYILHEALQRLPISFGMGLRTRPRCQEIAAVGDGWRFNAMSLGNIRRMGMNFVMVGVISQELVDKDHLFILGKGYSEPIAFEGALKLKELCYIHAEGFSGGALKHGPFALVEGEEGPRGKTPVIAIILDDEHSQLMRTAAEEVPLRVVNNFLSVLIDICHVVSADQSPRRQGVRHY